jgi:hypothetical protein
LSEWPLLLCLVAVTGQTVSTVLLLPVRVLVATVNPVYFIVHENCAIT